MPSDVIDGRDWARRRIEFLETELVNADERTRAIIEAEIGRLRQERPLRTVTPGAGFPRLRQLFRRRQA